MRFLVSLDETQEIFLSLRDRFFFRREEEEVCVNESLGRILAEDIVSPVNLPKNNLATMDGFAIRSTDSPPLRIIGEVFPDTPPDKLKIGEGECCYITTGSPLPEGADAVIKVEITEIRNGYLHFSEKIPKGKYVLKKGSEVREGELLIGKGRKIGPQEIAILTAINRQRVKVLRKLRVAVFSNGDEMRKGIIMDTNTPMIMNFIKQWGEEVHFLGTAGDEFEEVRNMILKGVKNYDVVITSGGVSVGKKDYVIRVLEEEGELILYKIKQRPGKPMAIGIVNDKPIFALPGKPGGAFVAMLSLRNFFLGNVPFPITQVKVARNVKIPTPGFKYIVFIKLEGSMGFPVGYKGSPVSILSDDSPYEVSLVSNMARSFLADGFVITEHDLKEGEEVEVNLLC